MLLYLRPARTAQTLRSFKPLAAISDHLPALAAIGALAIWLTRRWLHGGVIPAGTDFLGVITRAHENADWATLLSPWDPGSLGAIRPVSMDTLLGLITLVTGDAVVTLKVVGIATLMLAGATTYLVSWRWYRRRDAATAAALLYMISQASLSRWGSGQLNVELPLALAPLVIYLWVRCIEHPTWKHAAQLGLALSAVMFVRLDMVLYVVPFLGLHLVVWALTRGLRTTARNGFLTLAMVTPIAIGVVLVLLVPLAGGLRPHYLSGANLFSDADLLERSLGAFPSLLGFGREIGYFGFTGEQTWFSHPWVPLAVYQLCAAALVGLAYAALLVRRDERTLYLGAVAVVATFMGKGTHGPLGAPYLWAAHHVPIFADLRGPNRWLIVQSLAYAVLGGITLSQMRRVARAQWARAARHVRVGIAVASLLAAGVCVLPVAPTLVDGLRVWRPGADQLSLLRPIREERRPFVVASVPYDQTMRFLSQGSYRGWEHDLGAESALFTNHAALADGGWNQRAADFVAWSSAALARGDASVPEALAAIGIGRLTSFDYPATAPHLCPTAGVACTKQQRVFKHVPGLKRVATNRAGTVYALPAVPRISFRPNIAVVLGGRSGLSDLAQTAGVELPHWATFTADDILATSGLRELLRLLAIADRIQVSNATVQDVALLAAPSLATIQGITSDPGLDRETELVGSDLSTRTGSIADQNAPPPVPSSKHSHGYFTVRPGQRVEIWVREAVSPRPGRLTVRVDGRSVATDVPAAPLGGALQWWRIPSGLLKAGPHRIDLEGTSSPLGGDYEVDEIRVVDVRARETADRLLTRSLNRAADRVQYGLDLPFLLRGALKSSQERPLDSVGSGDSFWRPPEPRRTRRVGAEFSFTAPRTQYTILKHTFGSAEDWSGRPYAFLRYKGRGSGLSYRLLIDTERSPEHTRVYRFVDDRPGWRSIGFALPLTAAGSQDLHHVVGLRIATDRKDVSGSIAIGGIRLSAPLATVRVAFPVAGVADGSRIGTRDTRNPHRAGHLLGELSGDARAIPVTVAPTDLRTTYRRIVVEPPMRIREKRAVPVPADGRSTAYRYDFQTSTRGALVLAQGFDPRWMQYDGDTTRTGLPADSVTNGFIVGPGRHEGAVALRGRQLPLGGLVGSLFALIIALALATGRFSPRGPRARTQAGRNPPEASFPRGPAVITLRIDRPTSLLAAASSGALIAAMPVVAAAQPLEGVAAAVALFVVSGGRWRMMLAAAVWILLAAPLLVATSADRSSGGLTLAVLACAALAIAALLRRAAAARR